MYEDNNLFNPLWTTGSLSAIAPIVQVVGFIAMALISIGGFFMVILPIMRNVINGIVVVAPNLCERIDEAHRTKLGLTAAEGGNQIQMITGSLMVLILSFCPNFLAISDFKDGIKDPASFMWKAIPIMCIYVFIGVFVFKGYPAKFAEKFSQAGTSVIDMVLNNVDPVAWVEKIPTNLVRPDLSTSNATDQLGKNVNILSKSLFSTLTSKYGEMSGDNRIELSHEIERKIYELLREIDSHADNEKYKMTVETRVMAYDPELSEDSQWPTPSHDSKENIYIYQYKNAVSSDFKVGVPGGVEGDNYMVILKFYEQSDKSASPSNVTNILTIDTDDIKDTDDGVCIWSTDKVPGTFTMSEKITLNGKQGTVKSKLENGKTYYTVTFDGTKGDLKKSSGITSGLAVFDNGGRGYSHKVESVDFGSDYKCTPTDTSKWESWIPGGSPKPKLAVEGAGAEPKSGKKSDDN